MLDYTDHDGFHAVMHRATDENGRKLVEIIVSNPPRDGWSSGSNVQVPEEMFSGAVKEFESGRVEELMRLVCDWYVDVNEGAGFDAGDLVYSLEQAGFKLPEEDEDVD